MYLWWWPPTTVQFLHLPVVVPRAQHNVSQSTSDIWCSTTLPCASESIPPATPATPATPAPLWGYTIHAPIANMHQPAACARTHSTTPQESKAGRSSNASVQQNKQNTFLPTRVAPE